LLDNVAAEKIWKRFPSAVVVIDIFQKELGIFGNDASFSIGRRALEYLGITKDLLKHCRCWFYEAPTSVAKQHPLCQGPPRADGLAVIRFRIEGPNPGQDLLLPPRSDFLDGLSRQRNIEFENMIRNRLRKRHRYLLLPTLWASNYPYREIALVWYHSYKIERMNKPVLLATAGFFFIQELSIWVDILDVVAIDNDDYKFCFLHVAFRNRF